MTLETTHPSHRGIMISCYHQLTRLEKLRVYALLVFQLLVSPSSISPSSFMHCLLLVMEAWIRRDDSTWGEVTEETRRSA